MDFMVIYPIVSILCFASAILFFRKENVPFSKIGLPFIMSLLSPSKMKENMKAEGIWLVIAGYVSFIIYMFIS